MTVVRNITFIIYPENQRSVPIEMTAVERPLFIVMQGNVSLESFISLSFCQVTLELLLVLEVGMAFL